MQEKSAHHLYFRSGAHYTSVVASMSSSGWYCSACNSPAPNTSVLRENSTFIGFEGYICKRSPTGFTYPLGKRERQGTYALELLASLAAGNAERRGNPGTYIEAPLDDAKESHYG
jgi:hypothetical protein